MKISIKLFVSCSLLLTTMTYAQGPSNQKIKGNGKVISEKRTTASYDGISIIGFFDVELVSGKEGNITIKGEDNLLPYIKVEVVDEVLKISTEKNKYISTSKGSQIIITVPFENINQVSLIGSGDVITKNSIKSKSFSAKLTGSGDMKLDVETNDFNVNLSGSGDIVLTGKTENFNSDLNGSGDIDASDLKAKNAKITVYGSGDSKVFCSESLHARVSGSGDIEYTGDPKKKDTKVNGSGAISRT
ncbi:head GIN domain-containing protein [Flavobacterium sp. LB2R40]|uniref:head GIN domain-containing protein n=1 Tax=unclassified Flavobacterium TaxID=196869 RepID=UPI003AAE77E7